MLGSDMRKKFAAGRVFRGSQVVFGERQHLREVLRSIRSVGLPRARRQKEIRQLRALIQARTEELNRINSGWDRKYRKAADPQATAESLLRLAAGLPAGDFLLARALTEHPNTPGGLLAQLASHPYRAVRENVARHPHTPVEVLRRLADRPSEPLWFLVACNPSTPSDLRERLRARMRQGAGIP
jgi:hypothetical protein